MLTPLHTAASGLLHASQRLTTSAHNAANLNTANTHVLGTRGREVTGAGVSTQIDVRTEHRPELGSEQATDGRSPAPGLDAVTGQRLAVHHAGALRNVVHTADDMLGALIDAVG
jgi:hypothetical protein